MKTFIVRLATTLVALSFLQACSTNQQAVMSAMPMSPEEHQVWVDTNLDKALEKRVFAASNGMQMPYRIFLPKGYDKTKQYPLFIFLHGRGDRGADNRAKMFNSRGLFTGPQSIVSPNGQSQFESIVIIPQCSDKTPDEEWAHWIGNSPEQPFVGLGKDGSYKQHPNPSMSGAAALELIDSTISNYAVDVSRVYLTGTSMGGFGAWEFATRRPDLFAVVVPMAGFSDPNTAEKVKDIPIWVFHGDEDENNPVQGSRNMSEKLKGLNAEIKYTEYPGLNHGQSFVEAWKNTEILPWMFSKVKSGK